MKRLEANLEILKTIRKYAKANPELRFHQILWNLDIINGSMDDYGDLIIEDRYNESSTKTLADLQKRSDK